MMLQRTDGIEVQSYFRTRTKNDEFLGFLPVLNDALNYYSVPNIGVNTEVERVTPVFGKFSDVMTDIEYWYEKDISPKAREEDKLQHEYYRDEFLERVKTHKYCVWFVGCDDGDIFMRFFDKEDAVSFISTVEFFDEIYNHPNSMNW